MSVLEDQVVTWRSPGRDETVTVAVDSLRLGPSPRMGGVKRSHVEQLAELDGQWPPLLVRRADNTVIDGRYRYFAARQLGIATVECVYFDEGADEAYIEAVRRNVQHGLPLTVRERLRAAGTILQRHPEWADRRLAELCGVSPGSIARLRAQLGTGREVTGAVQRRSGRDNRNRPVDAKHARSQIAAALRADPTASLRQIARLVGSSPETVRSVRKELQPERPPIRPSVVPIAQHRDYRNAAVTDAALTATPQAAEFSAWFTRTDLNEEWRAHVDSVPLSRVYEIADEAHRRSQQWRDFALALESRVNGRRLRSSPSAM